MRSRHKRHHFEQWWCEEKNILQNVYNVQQAGEREIVHIKKQIMHCLFSFTHSLIRGKPLVRHKILIIKTHIMVFDYQIWEACHRYYNLLLHCCCERENCKHTTQHLSMECGRLGEWYVGTYVRETMFSCCIGFIMNCCVFNSVVRCFLLPTTLLLFLTAFVNLFCAYQSCSCSRWVECKRSPRLN